MAALLLLIIKYYKSILIFIFIAIIYILILSYQSAQMLKYILNKVNIFLSLFIILNAIFLFEKDIENLIRISIM